MADLHTYIPDTFIVPGSCTEQYMPLSKDYAQALHSRGIFMAGLSTLKSGFEIKRLDCFYHILIYTIAGQAEYATHTSKGILRPDELWIVPAHQFHHYWVQTHWQIAWLHVQDIEMWASFRDKAPHIVTPQSLEPIHYAMRQYLNESIHNTREAHHATRLYAELIGHYLDRELQFENAPADRYIKKRLQGLWEHVNSDLRHGWTLQELAAQMHLSQVQLYRWVTKYNNTTPMGMVHQLRMRCAKQLLIQSHYNISTIGDQLGYETPFSFSRAFKRYTGSSPKDYRKEYIKEET